MSTPTLPWGYRLMSLLLALPMLGYTLAQGIKLRDGRYLRQRLGWGLGEVKDAGLWLHCASVGEVVAATPLVRAWLEQHPQAPLLITTNTPTGAAMVARLQEPRLRHRYLPLDLPGMTSRWVRRLGAVIPVMFETEIWPRLYHQLHRQGCPPRIINGRISQRTLSAPAWLRGAYASALGLCHAIYARSETDAERFRKLGASTDQVSIVGNIKYAALPDPDPRRPKDFSDRPYHLAASTHADEEQQIAQAWLTQEDMGLLVIAPRHPQRSSEIEARLRTLTDALAVRSRGESIQPSTRLYLADTLGELQGFMAHAEAVFMGGSLIERGGHNILEPAALGCPIYFGPSMSNFHEEAELFLERGAAIQIHDAGQLMEAWQGLASNPSQRESLTQRAEAIMSEQADVLARYLRVLEPTA